MEGLEGLEGLNPGDFEEYQFLKLDASYKINHGLARQRTRRSSAAWDKQRANEFSPERKVLFLPRKPIQIYTYLKTREAGLFRPHDDSNITEKVLP